MAHPQVFPQPTEPSIWNSLKVAIAASSGFQCWQEEQAEISPATASPLESQVRRYLRQTLETLAY